MEEDTRKVMLDKERTLRLDFNALCKAEEATGKNFLTAESWSSLSAKDFRALTWAALLDEQPDLTLEQVGKMLLPRNERQVSDALLALYIAANAAAIDDKKTAETKDFANVGGGAAPSRE